MDDATRDAGVRNNTVDLMHVDRVVATFNFSDGRFEDEQRRYVMENEGYRIAFPTLRHMDPKWYLSCPTLTVKDAKWRQLNLEGC